MKLFKLAVHAPLSHADVVRDAIGKAGGGKIGNYAFCSFSVRGIGRSLPQSGASPHIGTVGKLEEIEEERIEVTVNEDVLKNVVAAIKSVHPYDEVTIDIYPLETV